jgi:hypothetical protein
MIVQLFEQPCIEGSVDPSGKDSRRELHWVLRSAAGIAALNCRHIHTFGMGRLATECSDMLGPNAWRGTKPAIVTMAGNAQHGAGDSPERQWSIGKDDLKWLVLAP